MAAARQKEMNESRAVVATRTRGRGGLSFSLVAGSLGRFSIGRLYSQSEYTMELIEKEKPPA